MGSGGFPNRDLALLRMEAVRRGFLEELCFPSCGLRTQSKPTWDQHWSVADATNYTKKCPGWAVFWMKLRTLEWEAVGDRP